jgi:hypothetical protein
MKTTSKAVLTMLALGAAAWAVTAQDGGNGTPGDRPPRHEGQGGPGRGGPRPVPPVIAVLDANHDGIIDATEIANASNALLKLDKNGDGQLTPDELRPPRPQGGGRPDGPQGEQPQPPQREN